MELELTTEGLAERIAAVQERIADAARRKGRNPDDVTLVAVSKTQPAEAVAAAWRAGARVFGENRVEEAGPKAADVAALLAAEERHGAGEPDAGAPVSWHMVGHVQSRKAAALLPWAAYVHSLDGERLARRLSEFSLAAGRVTPVLIEVNVTGEASKDGVSPEAVLPLARYVAGLQGLRIGGLMTIAPVAADPEAVRPVFAALRRLRDDLAHALPGCDWRHLSMGMTDDYPVAVEEGATLVRIGRAIFGERSYCTLGE